MEPSSPMPRSRRWSRLSLWGLRGALVLSAVVLSAYLWLRPVSPNWVSAPIPGGTNPIGFTPDGHLVTADGDFQPNSPPKIPPLKITTWDIETGQIVHQASRTIPLITSRILIWTGPTDSIVTRVFPAGSPGKNSAEMRLAVVSRQTGQLRYPLLPQVVNGFPVVSSDGRYMAVADESDQTTADNSINVIDVETGQSCLKFLCPPDRSNRNSSNGGYLHVESVVFTPDSRELVNLECDEMSKRWVVFRSIPGGHEVGRCLLPDFHEFQGIRLGYWSGRRLFFRADTPVQPGRVSHFVSFDLANHQLSERRAEPGLVWQMSREFTEARYTVTGDDWKVFGRTSRESQPPRWIEWFNRGIARISPASVIKYQPRPHAEYQFVDPQDDSPIGMPLYPEGYDGTNFTHHLSRDGHWLIDGGARLRVWRTPPSSRWWRLPGVGLVALAWWLCDRGLRQRLRRRNEMPVAAASN